MRDIDDVDEAGESILFNSTQKENPDINQVLLKQIGRMSQYKKKSLRNAFLHSSQLMQRTVMKHSNHFQYNINSIAREFYSKKMKMNKRINVLQALTHELDLYVVQKQVSKRISHLQKFIEIHIWERIVELTEFVPNESHTILNLEIMNTVRAKINELLFDNYVLIDRQQEILLEILVDIPQVMGLKLMRNSAMKERQTIKRKNISQAYFDNMDLIPYLQTTSYNFQIQYIHIGNVETVSKFISMREVINFYIAEGFYQYHSSYSSSKLTYQDIKNITQYIAYKIKSQNFLDMLYHLKSEKIIYGQNSMMGSAGSLAQIYKNSKCCIVISKDDMIFINHRIVSLRNRIIFKVQYYTKDNYFYLTLLQSASKYQVTLSKKLKRFFPCNPVIYFLHLGEEHGLICKLISQMVFDRLRQQKLDAHAVQINKQMLNKAVRSLISSRLGSQNS